MKLARLGWGYVCCGFGWRGELQIVEKVGVGVVGEGVGPQVSGEGGSASCYGFEIGGGRVSPELKGGGD